MVEEIVEWNDLHDNWKRKIYNDISMNIVDGSVISPFEPGYDSSVTPNNVRDASNTYNKIINKLSNNILSISGNNYDITDFDITRINYADADDNYKDCYFTFIINTSSIADDIDDTKFTLYYAYDGSSEKYYAQADVTIDGKTTHFDGSDLKSGTESFYFQDSIFEILNDMDYPDVNATHPGEWNDDGAEGFYMRDNDRGDIATMVGKSMFEIITRVNATINYAQKDFVKHISEIDYEYLDANNIAVIVEVEPNGNFYGIDFDL